MFQGKAKRPFSKRPRPSSSRSNGFYTSSKPEVFSRTTSFMDNNRKLPCFMFFAVLCSAGCLGFGLNLQSTTGGLHGLTSKVGFNCFSHLRKTIQSNLQVNSKLHLKTDLLERSQHQVSRKAFIDEVVNRTSRPTFLHLSELHIL